MRWFRAAFPRRADKFALAFFVTVMSIFGGYFAWHSAHAATLGAPCASDDDCRSDRCLFLYRFDLLEQVKGVSPRVGGICSRDCETDADCPAGLGCVEIQQSSRYSFGPMTEKDFKPNARGCGPR